MQKLLRYWSLMLLGATAIAGEMTTAIDVLNHEPSDRSELKMAVTVLEQQILAAKQEGREPDKAWQNRYEELSARLLPAGFREDLNPLDQGGETCSAASVIPSYPFSDSGTKGSTDDCSGLPYRDVFYVFTCTIPGSYTADMCGSDDDSYLKIWTAGTCCGGAAQTADDECGGMDPRKTFTLGMGQVVYFECGNYNNPGNANTYYFNLNGPVLTPQKCCYNNGNSCDDLTETDCATVGGTWYSSELCGALHCPITVVGGETCEDAVALPGAGTYYGSTAGNANDNPAAFCGTYHSNSAPDEWFAIQGTGNTIEINTCGTQYSYDTQLGVYCDCTGLICVAGNDDMNPYCPTLSNVSKVTFCSEPGHIYYIVVDGYGGAYGDYTLNILDGAPCSPYANCNLEARCCYLLDGVADCVDNLQVDCIALNGLWTMGESCASGCPIGQCCYMNGAMAPACGDLTQLECEALQGQWNPYSVCGSMGHCPALGRCCYVVPGESYCHLACQDAVFDFYCNNVLQGWWDYGLCSDGGDFWCPADYYGSCDCDPAQHSHGFVVGWENDIYYFDSYTPTVCAPIDVPLPYHITDLNVNVDINSWEDGELAITLESPSGTLVDLSSNNGGWGANYLQTRFDDEASMNVTVGWAPFLGGWQPEQALSTVDGENAQGEWLLCMTATGPYGGGNLYGVCLHFEYDYILPVELTSFDAVAAGNAITLNWSTGSESNMSHFEITRDGSLVNETSCTNTASSRAYSFVDNGVTAGVTYDYRLLVVDQEGGRTELARTEAALRTGAEVVTEYALYQNFPNPFNPETSIAFDLVEAGRVHVAVYNVVGQLVAKIVDGNMSAGHHSVTFDAGSLPSGLYLYKMEANGFSAQKKMVLMR